MSSTECCLFSRDFSPLLTSFSPLFWASSPGSALLIVELPISLLTCGPFVGGCLGLFFSLIAGSVALLAPSRPRRGFEHTRAITPRPSFFLETTFFPVAASRASPPLERPPQSFCMPYSSPPETFLIWSSSLCPLPRRAVSGEFAAFSVAAIPAGAGIFSEAVFPSLFVDGVRVSGDSPFFLPLL